MPQRELVVGDSDQTGPSTSASASESAPKAVAAWRTVASRAESSAAATSSSSCASTESRRARSRKTRSTVPVTGSRPGSNAPPASWSARQGRAAPRPARAGSRRCWPAAGPQPRRTPRRGLGAQQLGAGGQVEAGQGHRSQLAGVEVRTSPVRAANTSATRSTCSRRATNSSAAAEASSSQCASSTTATTGRVSAASASRLSTPRKTRNRSPAAPASSPTADPQRRAACGAGSRPTSGSSGRSSRCSAANASGASDSMPWVRSTVTPSASPSRSSRSRSSRSTDLPEPGSPTTTNAPPDPDRAASTSCASRACSLARPTNTRRPYPCSRRHTGDSTGARHPGRGRG